jgi:hypothetical protein
MLYRMTFSGGLVAGCDGLSLRNEEEEEEEETRK